MENNSRFQTYFLFGLVVLTCSLGGFTQTAVNAMLTGIGVEFEVGHDVAQLLTTIYMLVMGITVPVVTFLSHRLTTKSIVIWALVFFAAGCLTDMLSLNFACMAAGRVLQAVSSGITLPLVQSLAMTRFPPGQNATAMGVAGIAMGFAPNIGPTIGGAVYESWGWRSYFIIVLVISLVFLVAAFLGVKTRGTPKIGGSLDVVSFLLSTFGFGGLLMGFSNAATYDLLSFLVWLPILVGVICLILFVIRQNRVSQPLISMQVFKSGRYRVSFVLQNLLFASFMGITLILPLFMQEVWGATPTVAGSVFILAVVAAVIFNPLAGILTDRIGAREVMIGAGLCMVVGSAAMVFITADTPLIVIMLMQGIRGIGVSSLIGPMASYGLSELPHVVMMDGSAFFATVRQCCASLGTAIMMWFVVSFAVGGAGILESGSLGFSCAFGFSAVLAILVLIITVVRIQKNVEP